jgi:hypothetical protein
MFNRPLREDQVVTRHSSGNYTLRLDCVGCEDKIEITVSGKEMFELQTSGKKIQEILPHSASVRELFISGYCETCWDSIFKSQEEEDDE